jgi:hypothetical protein
MPVDVAFGPVHMVVDQKVQQPQGQGQRTKAKEKKHRRGRKTMEKAVEDAIPLKVGTLALNHRLCLKWKVDQKVLDQQSRYDPKTHHTLCVA